MQHVNVFVVFIGIAGVSAGCNIRRQTRPRVRKRHRLPRPYNGENIIMILCQILELKQLEIFQLFNLSWKLIDK